MKEHEDAYRGPPAPHGYHLVGWKGLHSVTCVGHPGGLAQAHQRAEAMMQDGGYDFIKIHRVLQSTTGQYTGECLDLVKKPAP